MNQKNKMNTSPLNILDDLVGKSFGLLTVIERAENDKFGTVYWKCQCRCETVVLRRANTLRAGKFFTCGKPSCRFWEKVYIPEGDGCWEWTGATKDTGYGVFKKPGEKKLLLAHVFSYELHNGLIEDGLWVLHKCDNRACVRPDHLFLGDHKANMKDMAEKGRASVLKPRLTQEARRSLLEDVQSGTLTYVQIAAKYGTSTQTIGRIAKGN